MKGAFPPSSIDAFLIVGAHWPSSSRPTSVDPVKLSFLTSGLPVSSPPIARDPPVITLNSPAGSPASSASAASASAEKGVSLAGFRTTAQPAASAGAILRVIMADGKFQRSEEHTSELQSLMRISYAVFCLKKKTETYHTQKVTTAKKQH